MCTQSQFTSLTSIKDFVLSSCFSFFFHDIFFCRTCAVTCSWPPKKFQSIVLSSQSASCVASLCISQFWFRILSSIRSLHIYVHRLATWFSSLFFFLFLFAIFRSTKPIVLVRRRHDCRDRATHLTTVNYSASQQRRRMRMKEEVRFDKIYSRAMAAHKKMARVLPTICSQPQFGVRDVM